MQTNFKLSKLALITATLAMAIAPVVALAEQNSDSRERPEKQQQDRPAQNAFCERFNNAFGKVQDRLEQTKEKIRNRKEDRHGEFEQRREERNGEIREKRETAKNRKDDYFEALRNRAQNEEQKQAAENFVNTVHQAIQTRKEAIDAATEAFRNGVDAIAQRRQQEAENAIAAYKAAVQAAIDKAKSSCEAGEDAPTIKQTFMSEMEAANQALKTSRKNPGENKTETEALRKTRNEALKSAQETFRQTMEQAGKELKTAFESTTE